MISFATIDSLQQN